MWILNNTTYNAVNSQFTTTTLGAPSFLTVLAGGVVKVYRHESGSTPWYLADWTEYGPGVELSDLSSRAPRFEISRLKKTYADDEQITTSKYYGLILVRLDHATQGINCALYQVDANRVNLIDGNGAYFDEVNGAPKFNVFNASSSTMTLQNKLGQAVDITWGPVVTYPVV